MRPDGEPFIKPTEEGTSILPAWLLDSFSEILMLELPGPANRAAIICQLLDEIRDTAEFVDDPALANLEMRSLAAVQHEAREHLLRMMAAAGAHPPLPELVVDDSLIHPAPPA